MPETVCNGVRLSWESFGDGEPVLLVAGTNMVPILWQLAMVPALVDAGYRVVTFANRGIEPSDTPPAPYSVGEMTEDTAALIDALDLAPCRIVGYSLGGFIAEELCYRRPELVRDVVLLASAGRGSAFIRLYARAEVDLATVADQHLVSHAARDAVLLVQPLSVLQNDDETVELMRTMLEATPMWTNPGRLGQWSADLDWIEDDERIARWPRLTQRALVVAFEDDNLWPPVRVREAADAMPNASYAEIAGATHGGLLTHGEDVSALLVDFFAAA
ncbi:MAG TPA: alpha/beta hydrolase [Acidimicrobiia bacterium]|jgi:pimeloyl-ACP methyl ester carboxylesterase